MLGTVKDYQMHLSCCFGPLSCSLGCVLPAGSLFRLATAAGVAGAGQRQGLLPEGLPLSLLFSPWFALRAAHQQRALR